jgi:hypothetical protein
MGTIPPPVAGLTVAEWADIYPGLPVSYECRETCPSDGIGTQSTCGMIDDPASTTNPPAQIQTTCLADVMLSDETTTVCNPTVTPTTCPTAPSGSPWVCASTDPNDPTAGVCARRGGRCGLESSFVTTFDDTFRPAADQQCRSFGEPRYCGPLAAAAGGPATAIASCTGTFSGGFFFDDTPGGYCANDATGELFMANPCSTSAECSGVTNGVCYNPIECFDDLDCLAVGAGKCVDFGMSSWTQADGVTQVATGWRDTVCSVMTEACMAYCDDIDASGNFVGEFACPAGQTCGYPTWTNTFKLGLDTVFVQFSHAAPNGPVVCTTDADCDGGLPYDAANPVCPATANDCGFRHDFTCQPYYTQGSYCFRRSKVCQL